MITKDGFQYGIIRDAIEEFSPFSPDHPDYDPILIIPIKQWNADGEELYETVTLTQDGEVLTLGVCDEASVEEAIALSREQITEAEQKRAA